MLPILEDPNTQKQLKRSEQIKKWNEREMMSPTLTSITNNNNNNNNMDINNEDEMTLNENNNEYQRSSKVRFPKGCVFLSACSSGDTDEVRAHLKLGVNINTTNIDGLTALHQACIDANIEMVKFLVDNQADINSQDNEGWSPLHAAVSVGNLEVSKYLISKGARLNICNNDSDLPIDLCDSSNLQMKEFLDDEMKRQGIDADYERKKEELIMYEDARDKQFEDKIHAKTGATPLHVSAAKGYTRVMR
jgi:protein phosphatase 1 regulatory subunit 12B